MSTTAKLLMNGRSQAVRLPANLKFECDWDEFFQLRETVHVPDDFMQDRDNTPLCDKDIF